MVCEGELLPGLPNDLALRCVALLPLHDLARCRALSHSWASLSPSSRPPQPLACLCTAYVNSERQSFLAWLFLFPPDYLAHFVPFFYRLHSSRPSNIHAYSSETQVLATGTHLLLVRSRLQFSGRDDFSLADDAPAPGALQGFDVWRMKWCRDINLPVPCMQLDRWGFAKAHVGGHVYVAGGEGADAGRSAERLHMETGIWEMLPEMIHERTFNPAGFVLGGCFYVAGGEFQPTASTEGLGLTQSGEYFDTEKGLWTLVEGMWPEELWGCGEGDPNIVVVKDVAYALSATDLMMFSVASGRRWEVRGCLPHVPGCDPVERWYLHWVSVNDDELWVIVSGKAERPWMVYSCKPHEDGLLHWERRPFTIPHATRYGVLASVGIYI